MNKLSEQTGDKLARTVLWLTAALLYLLFFVALPYRMEAWSGVAAMNAVAVWSCAIVWALERLRGATRRN